MNDASPPAHGADASGILAPSEDGVLRIVSCVSAATEWVVAFSAGARLVGRTDACVDPAVGHARVVARRGNGRFGGGGETEVDVASVAALAPDVVVVASTDQREILAATTPAAEILVFAPTSFKQVLDGALGLGRAVGASRTAMEWIAAAERTLALTQRAARAERRAARPPGMIVVHGDGELFSGGLWCADLIELSGARPLLTVRGAPPMPLDPGDVAAARPDIVVDASTSGIPAELSRTGLPVHRLPPELPIGEPVPGLYLTAGYLARLVTGFLAGTL
jgi:iron complex transport system substrate-binding protein